MTLGACVRALGAWKNALVEAQHGRKGMTPKYRESEGKERKIACQTGRVLVQHAKHARLPSYSHGSAGNE